MQNMTLRDLRDCRVYLHAADQSQRIKQLQCIIINNCP